MWIFILFKSIWKFCCFFYTLQCCKSAWFSVYLSRYLSIKRANHRRGVYLKLSPPNIDPLYFVFRRVFCEIGKKGEQVRLIKHLGWIQNYPRHYCTPGRQTVKQLFCNLKYDMRGRCCRLPWRLLCDWPVLKVQINFVWLTLK